MDIVVFIIQRIWIVLGRCLFLRSVHIFSWFLKSNWSNDFGHAEIGSGAKKRVVLWFEIFHSKFKVEWENGVWTKICFLARDSAFWRRPMRHFEIDFQYFSKCFDLTFFGNGFPNSHIVHSRCSFCLVNENSLNCMSGFVLLCFFNWSSLSKILAT